MEMRPIRIAVVLAIAVLGVLVLPSFAAAQGPMVEVNLNCEGIGDVTVHTNPRYLWVPGHVESDDGSVTHIVTSIFDLDKGATNDVLKSRIVECTVTSGPLAGLSVWGFFVPE